MNNSSEKTVAIITLGCSKNTVDSEFLSKQLEVNNLRVIHDPKELTVQTAIINTCGFINDAKEESIDTILEVISQKKQGDVQQIIVVGCLAQRYREELKKEMPEIDHFFGVFEYDKVVGAINGKFNSKFKNIRTLSTPPHYAYLKISEGCDRTCSFCAIPLIKGTHISKSIDDLIEETVDLTKKGVKELILIAQDLTYYGIDIYKKQVIASLVKELANIEELAWIRLHYAYPHNFPMDLLPVIRDNPKVCNYLDIPFQHINTNILRAMKRGIDTRQTYQLINVIRKEIPDVALRTTLMVGFPGEGEKEFKELLGFVKKIEFDRLGVFTYSEEEDTLAAQNFKDSISRKVKEKRMAQIMEMQESISLKKNKDKIGKTYKTLVERKEGEYFIGRTEYDSPEVDNEVFIKPDKKENIKISKFYNVTITNVAEHDLYGVIEGKGIREKSSRLLFMKHKS